MSKELVRNHQLWEGGFTTQLCLHNPPSLILHIASQNTPKKSPEEARFPSFILILN
mgnify:FL=1